MIKNPLARIGIVGRLLWVVAGILVFYGLIAAYLVTENGRQIYLNDSVSTLRIRLLVNRQDIERRLHALEADIRFLSSTPPVRNALSENFESDGESDTSWKNRLEDILVAFAEMRPEYYQIRLLGIADAGRELIRINSVDGRPAVVPDDQLQQKAHRDYFREASDLEAGEVYFSDIDLNREMQALDVPYKPTIRAATPVFSPAGKLYGLIVINMSATSLLASATTDLKDGVFGYFVNTAGEFLVHPRPDRSFGFEHGEQASWTQEFPGLTLPDSNADVGERSFRTARTDNGLVYVVVEPISMPNGRPVYLAYAIPKTQLDQDLKSGRNTVLVFAAVAIGTALVIFYFLLNYLFDPLRKLTTISEEIGEGKYSVSLPGSDLPEIRSLLRAFENMLSGIKLREAELRARKLRLFTLDNLVEGILALDLEGNILDYNQSMLKMHGFGEHDAVPKTFAELGASFVMLDTDGSVVESFTWSIDRILEIEESHDVEIRLRHVVAGWERILRYNGRVTVDSGGQRQLVILTARDVTESISQLHQLRQNEERFSLMINSVQDYAIFMLDSEGKVLTWNDGARRLKGYEEEDILGAPIDRFFLDEEQSAGRPREILDAALRDGRWESEGLRVHKDGTTFHADVTVTALWDEDGQHMGFVYVTRDVTERVLRKSALQAAEIAVEANRAKSEFLANMSHELRTPLNAIIGYSELILDDFDETENRQTATDLQRVLSAARHLLSLINDILDLAKIEVGRMDVNLEQFDVYSLVQDVVSALDSVIAGSGNSFTVNYSENIGEMHSDPVRVRQILINLLGNAGKFTSNGQITLSVSDYLEGAAEWIQFDIEDSGIGLSPEVARAIFEPFVQADGSTEREYGGTGLGLAISKSFVELLGGQISVDSTPGEGATFTVRLPRTIPVTISGEAEPLPEVPQVVLVDKVPGDGSLILIIEDDPHARELLSIYLERDGWAVVSASDGLRCVELAKQLQPAAILLDIIMPGKSGWVALEELKQDPEVESIPVVICSIVDDIKRGISLGAIDYLVKPVSRQDLTQSLERFKGARDGTGTVMIVDDDLLMRQILARSATAEGWNVIEVDNGKTALEKLATTSVDVLVLDLIMPEMDGYELIKRLGEIRAFDSLPIVVVTATDLDLAEKEWLRKRTKLVVEKKDPEQFYRSISRELAEVLSVKTAD